MGRQDPCPVYRRLGHKSSSDVALGSKLMLTYSLYMWDFDESTLVFFLNYGSIDYMLVAVTHYGLFSMRRIKAAR